jgi:hypothetical protein
VAKATCLSCGSELPPPNRGGRPRKWCSQKCRVWVAHHPGECRPVLSCRTCQYPLAPNNQSGYCKDHGWRRRQPEARLCEWCGHSFETKRRGTRFCSNACAQASRYRDITPEAKQERVRAQDRRKRARRRGVRSEPYTLAEIARRDRYRCGLCRKRVAMTKSHPHPKAPTIDHIVPLSCGGDDTKANVQLAHLLCNLRKHNRGGNEQLRLIG